MAKTTKSFLALLRGGNLGVPLVILCILAMVILPLPPALLDILFTFNIVLAVMVLLVAVSAKRPLEFSLFPTILLITTLMRLTLNVASTRVVLLHGHLGAGAAGKVIESFGQVVIGGNFVVGFVVFIISGGDRRQLCRRLRGVYHPDDHQLYCRHQRGRAYLRGFCPLYPGRDAR